VAPVSSATCTLRIPAVAFPGWMAVPTPIRRKAVAQETRKMAPLTMTARQQTNTSIEIDRSIGSSRTRRFLGWPGRAWSGRLRRPRLRPSSEMAILFPSMKVPSMKRTWVGPPSPGAPLETPLPHYIEGAPTRRAFDFVETHRSPMPLGCSSSRTSVPSPDLPTVSIGRVSESSRLQPQQAMARLGQEARSGAR
jgi:hypothetical protein